MEITIKKYALMRATVAMLSTPALAEEVGIGVGVGPAFGGVTRGPPRLRPDRDRTTVIKEREPSDRTTVIKKNYDDGTRSKTIIHDRD